jgi:hypothetical protein
MKTVVYPNYKTNHPKLDYLLIIMKIIKVYKEEQHKDINDNEKLEFKIVYLFLIYNLLLIVLCG